MIIQAKQINEWVERAYSNAVKHGWHEEEKSTSHWLMMVITEVAEAVQADRKDQWMDELDKSGLECVLANDHNGGLVEDFYKKNIEGKVESELADICIRMFDFMGVKNIRLFNIEYNTHSGECHRFDKHSFTRNAFEITKNIFNTKSIHKESLRIFSMNIIFKVFNWAEALNIDIVQHINLKMRYNESRDYHHGNKKY